jgi:hypothetical protein
VYGIHLKEDVLDITLTLEGTEKAPNVPILKVLPICAFDEASNQVNICILTSLMIRPGPVTPFPALRIVTAPAV